MSTGFKTATVASADVPATQTNFPVYIDLSRLGITTQAEADSVRVYADSSKTTEWAREIVSATEMHVKVPSLTSTTSIYVYWDGTSADYAVTDTYGRNAVWSDYAAVWHMQSLTVSSTGSYDLTNTDGGGGLITSRAGKIGNGAENDAGASRLVNGAVAGLTATSLNTWQAWIIKDAHVGYWIDHMPTSGGKRMIFYSSATGISLFANGNEVSSSAQTLGVAYQLTATKNNTNWQLYMNAVSQGTTTTGGANYANIEDFSILSPYDTFGSQADGVMDEVRFRNSLLSADWITTEYNNQSDEAGFWGTWSDVGGATNTTNFFLMM